MTFVVECVRAGPLGGERFDVAESRWNTSSIPSRSLREAAIGQVHGSAAWHSHRYKLRRDSRFGVSPCFETLQTPGNCMPGCTSDRTEAPPQTKGKAARHLLRRCRIRRDRGHITARPAPGSFSGLAH
jgi:hypothetical protein